LSGIPVVGQLNECGQRRGIVHKHGAAEKSVMELVRVERTITISRGELVMLSKGLFLPFLCKVDIWSEMKYGMYDTRNAHMMEQRNPGVI
jgi:hypothetical protein